MSSSPVPRTARLALILAAASWGVGTVISKRAVEEVPPLTLLPIQLAASTAVLALLVRWRGLPFRDPSASRLLAPLGILNPGVAYALSLLGLAHISASLSVLLWAAEPLLILLLAAILLGERIGRSVVVLSVAAVVGMGLVVYSPAGSGALVGVVLTLAGVACCAVYTVVARQRLGSAASTAGVVAAQQAWALAFSLVVVGAVALSGGDVRPGNVSLAGWASALASGVLYYGVAYWLYLSGLRHLPASVAAVSFYLIPVFGLAAGGLLLDERLDGRQWLGAATVLLAVYGVLRQATPSARRAVAVPGPAKA